MTPDLATLRAQAAEGRRLAPAVLAEDCGHRLDCDHLNCDDAPCPHDEPGWSPCVCGKNARALAAVAPALAASVEALAGECERREAAYHEETQGLAAMASGLHEKLERARTLAGVNFDLFLEERAALASTERDRDRLAAELAEARAETARAVEAEREACADVAEHTWGSCQFVAGRIRTRAGRGGE